MGRRLGDLLLLASQTLILFIVNARLVFNFESALTVHKVADLGLFARLAAGDAQPGNRALRSRTVRAALLIGPPICHAYMGYARLL